VTDRVTGYSRGFGFVRYANLEGAANGIKGMDGKVFIYVSFFEMFVLLNSNEVTQISV
jgi:RNA recognition motif-containing protein